MSDVIPLQRDPAKLALSRKAHPAGKGRVSTVTECPVCGSPVECGYDEIGRPVLHAVETS